MANSRSLQQQRQLKRMTRSEQLRYLSLQQSERERLQQIRAKRLQQIRRDSLEAFERLESHRCGACGNQDRMKRKTSVGLGWVCMDRVLCNQELQALPICIYCGHRFFGPETTCHKAPRSSDGTRFHEEGVG